MSKQSKNPNEILNAHVSEKVLKAIPEYVKEELDVMNEDELRKVVIQAHTSMKTAAEELAANDKYQQAKGVVDDLGRSKKDTDKYQKAKISYSLSRLEQIGKLDISQQYDLFASIREARQKLVDRRAKSKDIVQVAPTGKVTVTSAPESLNADDASSEEDNS